MKVDAQPPSVCLHLVSSFPLSQGQQGGDMTILYPPPSPSPPSTLPLSSLIILYPSPPSPSPPLPCSLSVKVTYVVVVLWT